MNTPWGESQHEERIAEGIAMVSTAGHGGILLSQERLAEMPASLRSQPTFNPYPRKWFEEDCEIALVILAFPEECRRFSQVMARETVRVCYPETYAAWLKELETVTS